MTREGRGPGGGGRFVDRSRPFLRVRAGCVCAVALWPGGECGRVINEAPARCCTSVCSTLKDLVRCCGKCYTMPRPSCWLRLAPRRTTSSDFLSPKPSGHGGSPRRRRSPLAMPLELQTSPPPQVRLPHARPRTTPSPPPLLHPPPPQHPSQPLTLTPHFIVPTLRGIAALISPHPNHTLDQPGV